MRKPDMSFFIVLSLILIAALGLTCCASRGVASRPVSGTSTDSKSQPDPLPDTDPAKSWYIEGAAPKGGKPYSCSFIEFDDRGDYLDFRQHRHAYEKIRELTKKDDKVAVVIFLHGWRNSSQSGNVTGFMSFLKQIAETQPVKASGRRIHGVYLGWRGGIFKPSPVGDGDFASAGFTKPIVDPAAGSPVPKVTNLLETFAYWPDKSLPEYKLSGTAISRSIYTCAQTAKRHGGKNDNRVFLIGHSFGALLLERTFMNATLGELTKEWAWGEPDSTTNANPLPFDAVLLVNSAAPSIYAKQFQGYLAAHRQSMIRNGVKGADAPIFISITSEDDKATGKVHPIGNMFAGWSSTLQRDYRGYSDFILDPDQETKGKPEPVVPQAEYYKRTPGHNPLLVNRWIEPCTDEHVQPSGQENCMTENLKLSVTRNDAVHFFTSGMEDGVIDKWEVKLPGDLSPANDAWSKWRGLRPVCWHRGDAPGEDRGQSAYWIMRCPGRIIANHNDIWNQRAMETYAALFRIADVMRR